MTLELFGYLLDEDRDIEVPSQLREVSLVADPVTLHVIAQFLEHTASLMEKHGRDFNHRHLADFAKDIDNDPAFVVVAPTFAE